MANEARVGKVGSWRGVLPSLVACDRRLLDILAQRLSSSAGQGQDPSTNRPRVSGAFEDSWYAIQRSCFFGALVVQINWEALVVPTAPSWATATGRTTLPQYRALR